MSTILVMPAEAGVDQGVLVVERRLMLEHDVVRKTVEFVRHRAVRPREVSIELVEVVDRVTARIDAELPVAAAEAGHAEHFERETIVAIDRVSQLADVLKPMFGGFITRAASGNWL